MKKMAWVVFLFISLAWPLAAKERCVIATPAWPERTQADGSGAYFDIMRAVFEPASCTLEIQIVPWKRALLMVESGEADLMLGWFYNPESPEATRFVKWPFDVEETVVVFKKSLVANWSGPETMENQKVLWPRGYNYQKFFNFKMDWSETNQIESGLSMLALDRTRFFMLGKNGLASAKPPPDSEIYAVKLVLTNGLLPYFSRTPHGKRLSEIYEQRMPALLESGELQKIYARYGRPMPELKPRQATK